MSRMLRMTEADLMRQRLKGTGKAIAKATLGYPLPKRPGRAQRPLIASHGQDWGKVLVQQMEQSGYIHTLIGTEYRFARPRRWRFDLVFPDVMWAVEIEGAVWTQGRHTRGSGFVKDMEKYNEAALLGWRLLRVTPEMVKNGQALKLIERALA